jgi:hypothetical protein
MDVLAASEATGDVAANLVEGVTGSRKDPGAQPVPLVQHAEEEVLGLHGARPEPAGLGAGGEEDLDRWLGESIEHAWSQGNTVRPAGIALSLARPGDGILWQYGACTCPATFARSFSRLHASRSS